MAQQVKTTQATKVTPKEATVAQRRTAYGIFTRDNLLWMIAGGVVMGIGYLLMSGGASKDPNTFDYNKVYSTTRITIAPIVILLGLAIEIYALFREPKRP
jgi:Protein of unknown function (DUF3098)